VANGTVMESPATSDTARASASAGPLSATSGGTSARTSELIVHVRPSLSSCARRAEANRASDSSTTRGDSPGSERMSQSNSQAPAMMFEAVPP
jgi:hypothetical protein